MDCVRVCVDGWLAGSPFAGEISLFAERPKVLNADLSEELDFRIERATLMEINGDFLSSLTKIENDFFTPPTN